MRRALVLSLLVIAGCDGGLGRPIVGTVDTPDADSERTCEVQPACVPVRTVPEADFELAEQMPPYSPPLDCDADLVEDPEDNCPGVPNPTQSPQECADAVSDCARLRAGDRALRSADLRGCLLDGPIELMGDLDLSGIEGAPTRLGCSALTFVAETPVTLYLDDAVANDVWLRFDGPISVSVRRTTIDGSRVSLEGGASMTVDVGILRNTALWLDPRAQIPLSDGPAPNIDVRVSSLELITVHEPPSTRAARMRVDRSTISASTINVPSLEVIDGPIVGARLAAADLSLIGTEVTASSLRSDFLSISSAFLSDVVFARCVDVRVSDTTMSDVDVPTCEPERFRALRTIIEASRIEGGLAMNNGEIAASVVVGGPGTSFVERDATVNGVKFCGALEAGFFLRGEIRCAGCDYETFMDGNAVCLSDTTLFERGCPAIELAPSCE